MHNADKIAIERELDALVHALARYQDESQFDQYLDCFTADGEYRIEVDAPEVRKTMVWMNMSRDELEKRLNSLAAHEWQIVKVNEQTRQVTVDVINVEDDRAQLSSTLSLFITDELGSTALYAVGRYDDRWEHQNGRWLLAQRVMKLKTRLLEPPSPLPL